MGNPQSIAVTPDGQYAYVVYPKLKSDTEGRIVRYDLKALEELGVCKSGSMDELRATARLPYYAKKGIELTERQQQIMDCMKF